MADAPPEHLSVPLTLGPDGSLLTVVQDSDADVDQGVRAVLRTRPGTFTDAPEFGAPSQVHRQGGADLNALEHAVDQWEGDRVDARALRDAGYLERLATGQDDVTIKTRAAGGG